MGLIRVRMTIKGKRAATVEALVDTGATFSVVPRSLAEKIGIPILEGVAVRLADGRREFMPRSTALITVKGRKVPATILVSSNGHVLLGAESLEALGMAVDPRRRQLKAVHSATVMAA